MINYVLKIILVFLLACSVGAVCSLLIEDRALSFICSAISGTSIGASLLFMVTFK